MVSRNCLLYFQECQNVTREEPKTVCSQVPQENCQNVPKEVCSPVRRNICDILPVEKEVQNCQFLPKYIPTKVAIFIEWHDGHD